MGIFHIAAAVVMTSPNPEKDILEPSIQGVKCVCRKTRLHKHTRVHTNTHINTHTRSGNFDVIVCYTGR